MRNPRTWQPSPQSKSAITMPMAEVGTFVDDYEIEVVQTDSPPGFYLYVRYRCPARVDTCN